MEIWKDIIGYEGLYQVSNKGNVKNKQRNKYLVPKKNNRGYLGIELTNEKHRKMFLIHRLVAQSFISNPKRLPNVNHKDENPKNNSVENLEWCSQSYNVLYSMQKQGKNSIKKNGVARNSKNKDTHKSIKNIEKNIVFENSLQIKQKYGYKQSSILDCCRGKRKTAYSYHWQFI